MSCEVFSLTILLLESPEKRSIAIAPAVQFKKFHIPPNYVVEP